MTTVSSPTSTISPTYGSVRSSAHDQSSLNKASSATQNLPPAASIFSNTTTSPSIPELLNIVKKTLELLASILSFFSNESSSNKGTTGSTTARSTGVDSSGNALPPSGEFLWKPNSDKDGKLAILLPSNLEDKVDRVEVVSPNGKETTQGEYAGVGNGDREHYRFSVSGASFADSSTVRILLKDGTKREVTIHDTAARLEQ